MVDHDQLFCAALATLLADEGFRSEPPIASLDDAAAAVESGLKPDLILVDPMTEEAGTALSGGLRRLRRVGQPARLIVLAPRVDDATLLASLEAEVDAYLCKTASFETLSRALAVIRLGEAVFPPRAFDLWDSHLQAPVTPDEGTEDGTAELSPRERQILGYLVAGLSNKVIARRLDITESTVKMHFKNLMRKTNAQNRTQAAVWAIQRGLAPPADL
jgi:two-component system nitrate/nitrite response regulator NarL